MNKKIFEETKIGTLKLKNRLWRAAAWENMADEKGHMTKELEKVFVYLAKGGVGTIITGYAFVCEEEQPNPRMLGIYDDSFIKEYKELTQKIHDLDTNIILQICYGGTQTDFNTEDRLIWGPSNVADINYGVVPTAMTQDDINYLIDAFTKASLRAQKAGFDGVQIHGAHAYLLSQFLMPYYNKRTDKYGGSLENRARIIYEIVSSIRKAVGEEFFVSIKIDDTDNWGDLGLTNEECVEVAKGLEACGISGIEISGGHKADPLRKKLKKEENQSYFFKEAAAVADAVNIPVTLVGGNRSVSKMEEILNNSKIEYFAMARALHSEPDLPNKWKEDYTEKLRCVSCNNCWAEDANICILDRKKVS